MRKLTALIAGGLGYVLGARAGRQRYEQLRQAATRVKSNPKVQQTAQQAKEAAPVLKEKVTDAASKVKGGSDSSSSTSTTVPTSTVPPTTVTTTTAPLSTTETTAASTATTPSTVPTATPSSPSSAPLSSPPA